mmetsp:Transcript_18163/g.42032  ORF Transcript_18163/g.42032 Transcript_18163/m.42032 type:complete len:185 (+) Transcript_18163:131-685(+)
MFTNPNHTICKSLIQGRTLSLDNCERNLPYPYSSRANKMVAVKTLTNKEIRIANAAVTFGNVHIHEFQRTVGDNPACRGGPPLALSSERVRHEVFPMEKYESIRDGCRRSKQEFLMSRTQRRQVLLQTLSKMQIYEAEDEATKNRELRQKNPGPGRTTVASKEFGCKEIHRDDNSEKGFLPEAC